MCSSKTIITHHHLNVIYMKLINYRDPFFINRFSNGIDREILGKLNGF